MDLETRAEFERLLLRVSDDWPEKAAALAVRHGILPLSIDVAGLHGLRRARVVVKILYDHPNEAVTESSERIRNAMLAQGAKRYPGLHALVPVRSATSVTCPACSGTGENTYAKSRGLKNVVCVVCYCGGLGWIPEEGHTNSSPVPR